MIGQLFHCSGSTVQFRKMYVCMYADTLINIPISQNRTFVWFFDGFILLCDVKVKRERRCMQILILPERQFESRWLSNGVPGAHFASRSRVKIYSRQLYPLKISKFQRFRAHNAKNTRMYSNADDAYTRPSLFSVASLSRIIGRLCCVFIIFAETIARFDCTA